MIIKYCKTIIYAIFYGKAIMLVFVTRQVIICNTTINAAIKDVPITSFKIPRLRKNLFLCCFLWL